MTLLSDLCSFLARLFAADRACGASRSPRWARVRKEHLAREPACEACGRGTRLEVHHVVPFHLAPELELDPDNLMTLCDPPCHLWVGHLGDYKSWNADAREDAEGWLEKIRRRPYAPRDAAERGSE